MSWTAEGGSASALPGSRTEPELIVCDEPGLGPGRTATGTNPESAQAHSAEFGYTIFITHDLSVSKHFTQVVCSLCTWVKWWEKAL
jgi:ABC-type dipeptide/oligopeptide/nickel transport system ATPase component